MRIDIDSRDVNSLLGYRTTSSRIVFAAVFTFFGVNSPASISAAELTLNETFHSVICPDPRESPCVMKKPIATSDFTFVSKPIDIQESNGLWIVKFDIQSKGLIHLGYKIRVLDFYGAPHTVSVTFQSPSTAEPLKEAIPSMHQSGGAFKPAAVAKTADQSEAPLKSNYYIDFKVNASRPKN